MSATRVTISFYKPHGYEDRYVVFTEDRGLAITQVMKSYLDVEEATQRYGRMKCMNFAFANLISDEEGIDLVARHRHAVIGLGGEREAEILNEIRMRQIAESTKNPVQEYG